MNQIIQFFLGNAWLLIPVAIGLFNVAVRVKQQAVEQKAKRDSLTETQRRKLEALRTGKPVEEPLIISSGRPEQKSSKSPAQERQERIEVLRKQRMDQLRAMREKRAGGVGTVSASRSVQSRTQRPILAPRGNTQQRPVRPAQPPRATLPARPQLIAVSQPARPQPQSPSPAPAVTLPPTIVDPPSTQPVSAIAASTLRDLRKDRPNKGGIRSSDASGFASSTRGMLRDPRKLRQALVLREVLNAPVSLRDPAAGPSDLRF